MSETTAQLGKSDATVNRSAIGSLRRWILALLGILCVGLGALGAVVPGLPTTIFLIAACYLFARSCPVLERKLVRHRFFAPFHPYLDGTATPSRKARAGTLLVMWLFITVSTISLLAADVSPWIVASIPAAGLIGSYFVAVPRRFGLR